MSITTVPAPSTAHPGRMLACAQETPLARQPRRTRSLVSRMDIMVGIAFAVLIAWLTLIAIGMGV